MADPNNIAPPNLPLATNSYDRRWQDNFSSVLRLFFVSVANAVNEAIKTPKDQIELTDGVDEPVLAVGRAIVYVDSADGDLKIKFSDGTIKTIITDS